MFMRLWRMFPALHVYPSDTLRQGQIPVGMGGLRHKSRHKSALPHSPGDFTGTLILKAEAPLVELTGTGQSAAAWPS